MPPIKCEQNRADCRGKSFLSPDLIFLALGHLVSPPAVQCNKSRSVKKQVKRSVGPFCDVPLFVREVLMQVCF